jgi:hypothetical protein
VTPNHQHTGTRMGKILIGVIIGVVLVIFLLFQACSAIF